MKKNLFALLNICTILLSLFLTGCSGKESKITLNSSQPECILSNNNNIVLESYTNESVLDDEIPERSITCWGDSMMQGAGCNEAYIYSDNGIEDISYFTTPSALQYFTSINTYNFGVGGENSFQISLRAGGIPIYTDRDIYITDHSLAYVKFVDENEETIDMDDYSGYGYEDNTYPDTVYINDVLCCVERADEGLYISICSDADCDSVTEMYINAWTRVIPKAAYDHRNDILILEMGSNGGWENDYDELIKQYQNIIDNSYYADYIIVGDTDNPGESADIYQDVYDNNGNYAGLHATLWEQALYDAFEEHFLNTRLYLMENALSDCGLTPTENDIIDIQTGNLPEQIRADFTHFNSYGYYSKAKAIYLKGIELGYWN